MKKIILSIIFAAAIVAAGCEEKKSAEPAQAKSETPKEITINNVGSLSFEEIDINKDGRFTYDEFDKITKNNGNAEGNTVYAEYDVDGNGIISEEEFSGK